MWFARLRRRRQRARVAAMFATLHTAEAEQAAHVTTDPEHQARIAELRAEIANLRAAAWPGRYPR